MTDKLFEKYDSYYTNTGPKVCKITLVSNCWYKPNKTIVFKNYTKDVIIGGEAYTSYIASDSFKDFEKRARNYYGY